MWHSHNVQEGISLFFPLKSKNVVWVENSPADETDILSVSTAFFDHTLLETECLTLFLSLSCDNVASSLQNTSNKTPSQTVASLDHRPRLSAQGFYTSVGGSQWRSLPIIKITDRHQLKPSILSLQKEHWAHWVYFFKFHKKKSLILN